jgi:hypothetical protein
MTAILRSECPFRFNQRPLAGEDEMSVFIQGYSDNIKDTEIVIENKNVGAGMKIAGDRPLIKSLLWSIRTVLAVAPYVSIDVPPGAEFAWKNMYEYYTMPADKVLPDHTAL